jgi:hypothetical protein
MDGVSAVHVRRLGRTPVAKDQLECVDVGANCENIRLARSRPEQRTYGPLSLVGIFVSKLFSI